MNFVVNDANILIDLIKLDLLHPFFQLPFHFYTTDLILENELYDHQKNLLRPYIGAKKLNLVSFDERGMLEIFDLQSKKPMLSDKDCSALLAATKLSAILLSSDRALRRSAELAGLEVHGHLWLLDQMVKLNCLSCDLAVLKLNELLDQNTALGLPIKECDRLRKEWFLTK